MKWKYTFVFSYLCVSKQFFDVVARTNDWGVTGKTRAPSKRGGEFTRQTWCKNIYVLQNGLKISYLP